MNHVDRIDGLAAFLDTVRDLPRGRRSLVALAGPPGAGKSTLADLLVAQLVAERPGSAAALGMDGFHYDDAVLTARGLRPRKGAPETFDLGGLATLLGRLAANAEPDIAIPVFDRALEIARAGAAVIPAATDVVVVEGNYLALDRPGWRDLRRHFALEAYLDVPRDEIERRLAARWIGYGLGSAAIVAKLEGNDLPNARLVSAESRVGAHRLVWRPPQGAGA